MKPDTDGAATQNQEEFQKAADWSFCAAVVKNEWFSSDFACCGAKPVEGCGLKKLDWLCLSGSSNPKCEE